MANERKRGLLEWMGIEEALLEPGKVRCRLTTTEAHQNIQGVIHGSIPFVLMDTAMGHALDSLLEPGEFCSTTQFSLQFQRAARPGDGLEAVGEVARKGRRIAYLEGTCTNVRGEVVARAQGTWYVGRAKA